MKAHPALFEGDGVGEGRGEGEKNLLLLYYCSMNY